MIADYHMHLENGSMTVEYIKQFVDAALARGVDEIGISEHGHHFREYWPIMQHIAEGEDAFPEIVNWMKNDFAQSVDDYIDVVLQAKAMGLPVKLGIELDYVPGMEEKIARFTESRPWDYVLGSVHFLGKWGIDLSPELGWPGRDVDAVYEEYLATLQMAARSGLFDVITHPDLVKIFCHRPSKSIIDLYHETAQAMADGGVCCEVSAAGLRKPVREIYPVSELLLACQERQVPITFSSDAHWPEDAGLNVDKAVAFAKQCGYEELAVFSGRRRILSPLS